MPLKYVVVTAPSIEPVTVEDQLMFSRIDAPDDVDLLTAMIKEAREEFEDRTRLQLINATYDEFYDAFPSVICLSRNPVQSVSSISYIDSDGDTQTLSSSNYVLDNKGIVACIHPAPDTQWPDTQLGRPNTVTVRYVAGHGSAATSVPYRARQYIMIRAARNYDDRHATMEVSEGLERIINNMKVPFLA